MLIFGQTYRPRVNDMWRNVRSTVFRHTYQFMLVGTLLAGCGGSGAENPFAVVESDDQVQGALENEDAEEATETQTQPEEPVSLGSDSVEVADQQPEVAPVQPVAEPEDTDLMGSSSEIDLLLVDNSGLTLSCEETVNAIRSSIDPGMTEATVRTIVGRPTTFSGTGNTIRTYRYFDSSIRFQSNFLGINVQSPFTVTSISPGTLRGCCTITEINAGTEVAVAIETCASVPLY